MCLGVARSVVAPWPLTQRVLTVPTKAFGNGFADVVVEQNKHPSHTGLVPLAIGCFSVKFCRERDQLEAVHLGVIHKGILC